MFFQNKIFIISPLEQIWKIVFIVVQSTNVFCKMDIFFPFFQQPLKNLVMGNEVIRW